MPKRFPKIKKRQKINVKALSPVKIPNKLFFRIGEVSKLLEMEPYVLRFWESEFPTLNPTKGANGRRMYRKRDIEMALRIKHLLYKEGFTIIGARKAIAATSGVSSIRSWSRVQQASSKSATSQEKKSPDPEVLKVIHSLESELHSILTILNRRC